MEKRASKRVIEKLNIDFFYGNEVHEGAVMDLSCNGLQIDAEICPPIGSDLQVVLILGDEIFKLNCNVKRFLNTNDFTYSMGVELSTQSDDYCDFVAVIKDFFYQKK